MWNKVCSGPSAQGLLIGSANRVHGDENKCLRKEQVHAAPHQQKRQAKHCQETEHEDVPVFFTVLAPVEQSFEATMRTVSPPLLEQPTATDLTRLRQPGPSSVLHLHVGRPSFLRSDSGLLTIFHWFRLPVFVSFGISLLVFFIPAFTTASCRKLFHPRISTAALLQRSARLPIHAEHFGGRL